MRKVFVVSVSAVATIALTSAPASAAAQDSVTGSGKIDLNGVAGQVIVNAHGDLRDARGHIKMRLGDGNFADLEADVTSIRVTGNRAVVSGVVKNDSAPFPYVAAFIVDNGAPGEGGTDLVAGILRTFDVNCVELRTAAAPVEQGNFTVKDRVQN